MIRIVNITPVLKRRVKEMIEVLMPEVGYVRVSNSGVVTLKKHWYSFKRVQTNATDLLIGVLPVKIAEYTHAKNNGLNYMRTFNQDISNILSIRLYNPLFDVCDYVWEQYNKHCVDVSDIILNTQNELIFLKKNNYLPSISPNSSVKVKDLIQAVLGTDKDRMTKRIINKVDRMKNTLAIKDVHIMRIFFNGKPIFTTA
jgi:hypothetical protein